MWFFLAIVAVVVTLGLTWSRYMDPKSGKPLVGAFVISLAKYFSLYLLAAFALTFAQDCFVIIPAGHRGIVFDVFKGLQPKPLKEGMNFIIPFKQRSTLIDIRLQVFQTDGTAASKDLQIVHAKVAVNFYPPEEELMSLYQQVGLQYADKIISPAVQEMLKSITARYTAEELVTRREDVKKDIQAGLEKELARAHIKLVHTYITDFDFSDEFAKAIEEKQVAEQQALMAQRQLVRVKIEAEQQLTRARAEAEGLRLQREAVSGPLVELRRIETQSAALEKWNGHLPRVILGQNQSLVNVSKFTQVSR